MNEPERLSEPDPRLTNPDLYFVERYGEVLVDYGEHTLPLKNALKFEQLARKPEDIESDPKERRANVFINMLRSADALEPEDDVTYEEGI